MADSSEPKQETVRVTDSAAPAQSRPTVRFHLPTRPPTNPLPVEPTNSPSPAGVTAATSPAPMTVHIPKKETLRITVSSESSTKPAKVAVPLSAAFPRIDEIPMPLCWGLLAASATTLILQIWNYLS